jgi:hypothetical protein
MPRRNTEVFIRAVTQSQEIDGICRHGKRRKSIFLAGIAGQEGSYLTFTYGVAIAMGEN